MRLRPVAPANAVQRRALYQPLSAAARAGERLIVDPSICSEDWARQPVSAYNRAMPNPDAITNLLKAHEAGVSAVKANKALLAMGILEQKERPSSKYPDKIKKYKALTEEGLKYGENRESMTSDETTPYYFKDSFPELLERLQTFLKDG